MHLSAALGNHSVRWLHLEGQATTFNWQRVLQPANPYHVALEHPMVDGLREVDTSTWD